MKKLLFLLLVLSSITQNSYNQQETDLRELFLAAESYYLFEEFNEALPLYLRIHRHYPKNDNINYKIGVCFLNNPYEKNKSIAYLEEAAQNINPKYKENNFKEKAAPPEALFYLGNAYRVNNQLSKARYYYNLFLQQMDPDIYDTELVNEQIQACDLAEEFQKNPIDFDVENLSDKINTRFADMNPVVSGDETKMAFISKLQFYDAVFYTEKINGEWTHPRNIVPELGVDGDVYPTALSYNGTEMFVYRNDDYIGNIYSTRFVNGKWTPLQKLGDNINTKYWESHASVSKDGKTLYFASNRKGGFGGLDIYRSERMKDGKWGPAVNLGPVINTKYNDDTPFISQNGNRIYFSSYGHHSMGGYDIFLSKNIGDTAWSEPINLGYPINSTDDDQFYLPVLNGTAGYYSKYTEQGFGRHDIFRYTVYDEENPRLFKVSGLLDFMGEVADPENINIIVVDRNSKDTVDRVTPDEKGNFSIKVPAGSYQVNFESEKFNPAILNLDVPANSPHEGFFLDNAVALELKPLVIPQKDISEYLSIREDSVIFVENDKEVKIRYNAEPGTFVDVEVKNQDDLVYTDSLMINKKRQSFTFTPEPGENKLRITIRDKDGNTSSQSVTVIRKTEPGEPVSEAERQLTEISGQSESTGSEMIAELSDAEKLRLHLIENSDGNLKDFLKNIDTKALNLISEKDLIDYLYESTGENNYSSEELNDLLVETNIISDIDALTGKLAEKTENTSLKEQLLGIDPQSANIKTEKEVFDYLYQNADSSGYESSDVDNLILNYYKDENLENIIDDMIEVAGENLKEYLISLDPEKENIKDFNGLVSHLLDKASENNYSTEDVYRMLERYLLPEEESNKNSFVNQLRINPSTSELISGLSDEEIAEMSERNIIIYLMQEIKAGKAGMDEVIISILIETQTDPSDIVDGLNLTSSENLKEYIEGLREIPASAVEFYKQLLKEADSNESFDRDDIRDAFVKYLENRQLIDFLNAMKVHASGDLLEVLKHLDPFAENILSRSDLIKYLLNNADRYAYTRDEVYRIASLADRDIYFNSLIDRLIKIAEGGLKQALTDLKESGMKVKGSEHLIDYLMKNRDKYGYSTTDIFKLLEKAGERIQLSPVSTLGKSQEDKDKLFGKGVLKTGLILFGEGLIILLLILLVRRKKKNKE